MPDLSLWLAMMLVKFLSISGSVKCRELMWFSNTGRKLAQRWACQHHRHAVHGDGLNCAACGASSPSWTHIHLGIKTCWFYLLKICAIHLPFLSPLLTRLRNCLSFPWNIVTILSLGLPLPLLSIFGTTITVIFLEVPPYRLGLTPLKLLIS